MSVARTDERRVVALSDEQKVDTKIDEQRLDSRELTHTRKQVGLAFVTLPFVAFVIFAIGEAASLEPGWWSHLLQVGAVALLTWAAWMYPRIGGPLLIVVGAVFTVLIARFGNGTFVENMIAVGIFFAPLIIAGIFFSFAGYGVGQRRQAAPPLEP